MYTYPLAIHMKIVKAAMQLIYWIRTHLNLHKKFAVTFTLFKFWQVPPTNMIPIYEPEREFALIVETTKGVVDCLSWFNESEHWNAFVIGYSGSCLLYTFNVAITFLYRIDKRILDEKKERERERERKRKIQREYY